MEMRELLSSMTRDAKYEIEEDEKDILALVRAMGGDQRRYKRERRSGLRAVISEVYSAPRITAAIKQLPGLGSSLGSRWT